MVVIFNSIICCYALIKYNIETRNNNNYHYIYMKNYQNIHTLKDKLLKKGKLNNQNNIIINMTENTINYTTYITINRVITSSIVHAPSNK